MERPQLTLEYIKVLIWPVILVLALLLHGDKFFDIIENREFEAFGLRVGGQIDDIEENYKKQITQLKEEIERLASTPGRLSTDTATLLEKVQGIENNLGKQLSSVKSNVLDENSAKSNLSDKERAKLLERAGFEYLLSKDIENALKNFSKSKELWPIYHNVAEINRLLEKNKSNLANSNDVSKWNDIYRTILNKYSWGMPDDIRAALEESLT